MDDPAFGGTLTPLTSDEESQGFLTLAEDETEWDESSEWEIIDETYMEQDRPVRIAAVRRFFDSLVVRPGDVCVLFLSCFNPDPLELDL